MTNDNQTKNKNHEARIVKIETRVEEGFRSTNEALTSLANTVKALAENTTKEIAIMSGNSSRDIKELAKQFQMSQRTNWPVLISAAALIFAIIGMWGSGWTREIERTDMNQEQTNELILKHIQEGDPYVLTELDKVYDAIHKLEDRMIDKTSDRWTKQDATQSHKDLQDALKKMEDRVYELTREKKI